MSEERQSVTQSGAKSAKPAKAGKSSEAQWKRSVKHLEQVTKALKLLSGITVTLNKRVRRTGRYLRSLLGFDEINRLNAPLKGTSKRKSRRRSRRRSTGRKRTTQKKERGLGWMLRGLKGLGALLKQVWKQLKEFFRSRKWTAPKNFERLAAAAKQLGGQLKGALDWGYQKVLKPLGNWTLQEAAPALMEALAKALGLVSKVLEVLSPLGKGLWDTFLEPLAGFAGDLVVNALETVGNAFGVLTGLVDGLGQAGKGAMDFLSGVLEKGKAFAGWLAEGLNTDWGTWLEENVLKPMGEPLLTLKVALSEGPADLWNSFKAMWEQNPALKALVELAQSGWNSVADWVKEHIGGGVSKAIELAKDGWSSVSGWVKDHLGGGVSKAVALAKDGWSSVSSWVREHIGGGVSKGVALARDGWSSVSSWVRDHVGKGVSLAVNLAKGWKGTVAKALGLGNLSSKFQIKLPKVSVSWSGSPIKLPHFSLKWNAKGGILNGATLFGLAGNTLLGGGEAGREAVLPLDRNTGWMNTLADKVAERVGGSGSAGQPIRVQVVLDGRVVAESTVQHLKRQAAQGRHLLSGTV